MRSATVQLILIALCFWVADTSRLSVSGNRFLFNGTNVFLSGVNFAWNSYGYDFGNGRYAASSSVFGQWLSNISYNGGNVIRVWLHVEGSNTPSFDPYGFVLGPDQTGTLINDMKSFLDLAKSKNVMVIFCLWNGALQRTQNVINLFWDNSKLQSYLDKVLTPMVTTLKGHPALAAWDVLNEPEGLVYSNKPDANECFNTVPLANSGAGWTGKWIPMNQIQRFINWHAAAIKTADPGALVTVGSWSEHSITDTRTDARNFYSDTCLISAGSKTAGKLDYHTVHTYSPYGSYAPFKVNASSYSLTKPLVIGEFSSACSEGRTIQQMFNYAYTSGYQGALGWQYTGTGSCTDYASTLDQGLLQLKGKNTASGKVNFVVA